MYIYKGINQATRLEFNHTQSRSFILCLSQLQEGLSPVEFESNI